ncbi:hypothetical protein E3E31_08540 [Thermococcus sp. M39]|uniref:hypothetical protein n=1 Tax=Thermococcus sp. M39 TaxID=1638262 RepID=UPI00143CB726|nr:hypothetical protein [Thermococcus sp. M39]NJE08567.1 hypothetical protein [Thermococcus sp. M39]
MKWAEFQQFWRKNVIIMDRTEKTTYVGKLVQETSQFITLKNCKIVTNGKAKESEYLAIWKGKIGVIKLAEQQPKEGEDNANTKDSKA